MRCVSSECILVWVLGMLNCGLSWMNSFRSFQAFRNGGANEDIADWITGDVPRASKKAADEI